MNTEYQGFVPYLFYDDADAAMAWYTRVFGFEELGRWCDDNGKVQNAEMKVGSGELWLDGSGYRADRTGDSKWIGIWVADVDVIYERVRDAGVACEPPVDREFGVRMLNVADDFGYTWGFIRRLSKS